MAAADVAKVAVTPVFVGVRRESGMDTMVTPIPPFGTPSTPRAAGAVDVAEAPETGAELTATPAPAGTAPAPWAAPLTAAGQTVWVTVEAKAVMVTVGAGPVPNTVVVMNDNWAPLK